MTFIRTQSELKLTTFALPSARILIKKPDKLTLYQAEIVSSVFLDGGIINANGNLLNKTHSLRKYNLEFAIACYIRKLNLHWGLQKANHLLIISHVLMRCD